MKIRVKLAALLFLASCALGAAAQEDAEGKYFPYPKVPDEGMDLTQRANYLALHFWDKCNQKSAFSDRRRMERSFADWTGFFPYTTIDTALLAVDKAIAHFPAPEQTLDLARLAEKYLYGDSAELIFEALYEPFVNAVVKAKKVSSADKARFKAQQQILACSQVGRTLPDIGARGRDGQKTSLRREGSPASVLLFVNDPECDDCRMARVRLAGDYNTRRLVEDGVLRVLSVYPGEYDEQWAEEAATYPADWDVVAVPDIDQYIDLRAQPAIYYLDNKMKVLKKGVDTDYILGVFKTYVTSRAAD